ncbi:MAG: GNAT family N-acetyltransferase [Promethearchaeota archaeon]
MNIRTISNLSLILKYLQLGTTIPITPEFHKYIISDLQFYNAKSLIILDNNKNPIGHVLVFNDESNILYFGYFGVHNHNVKGIEFLLEEIKNFAINNGFKKIKGPINIPTVLYGWGFMEEGSSTSLFVGKPVNPPIYNKVLLKKGYMISTKFHSYEGYFARITEDMLEKYDYSEYEIYIPETWDEIIKLKNDYLSLNARNLMPEDTVTPSVAKRFENYLQFIKDFGEPSMFIFLRYKKNDKLIGCFTSLPNPFRKDNQGKYDSFVAFTLVLDKKYRDKGLGLLLTKHTLDAAVKRHNLYVLTPIEESKVKTIYFSVEKGKISLSRMHSIFELDLLD